MHTFSTNSEKRCCPQRAPPLQILGSLTGQVSAGISAGKFSQDWRPSPTQQIHQRRIYSPPATEVGRDAPLERPHGR
jgi:hypothetical protein